MYIYFKEKCFFSLCFQVALSCQNTIQQCRLFDKFCHILMAVGIPADILTETIGKGKRINFSNHQIALRSIV